MNRTSGFFSRWFVGRRANRRVALYPYTEHPAFHAEGAHEDDSPMRAGPVGEIGATPD